MLKNYKQTYNYKRHYITVKVSYAAFISLQFIYYLAISDYDG